MLFATLAVQFACAEGGVIPAPADTIDRNDPSFVKASLLVMGPGEELYACAGHACFRLECPKFNLDYCFSYEGESASDQIIRFLSGRLKMGMFAIPTDEFLRQYRETGRGVRQYTLNLSPPAKVRLWKLFDDLVAKGADLPYDYIKRGCAQSTLHTLLEGIRPDQIVTAPWGDKFNRSRREILHSYIADYPWTCLLLHTLTGPDGDYAFNTIDKIIIPDDLLQFLRSTKVNGEPILTAEGVELLPQTLAAHKCYLTPIGVAVLLAFLPLVGLLRWGKVIAVLMLIVQSALGCIEAYIVFFSSLPASSWNWLLIPFNPLPLVFWKWRRHWALPFAAALLVWEGCMLFAPHRLTDPAYLVLVAGYVVLYAGLGRKEGRLCT